MTPLLRIALASAWNRRATLALTVLSIALSVTMLLGVERARVAAHEGFQQSVSGTDLVVGARTSPVQLMLYAVFRLGEATNNVRWSSFEAVAALPTVAWAVPLSLGDSHHGFAVLGTSTGYFEHFRYGYRQPLALSAGRAFSGTLDGVFEAVIGAEVARSLGYGLGQRITLSHGSGGALLLVAAVALTLCALAAVPVRRVSASAAAVANTSKQPRSSLAEHSRYATPRSSANARACASLTWRAATSITLSFLAQREVT